GLRLLLLRQVGLPGGRRRGVGPGGGEQGGQAGEQEDESSHGDTYLVGSDRGPSRWPTLYPASGGSVSPLSLSSVLRHGDDTETQAVGAARIVVAEGRPARLRRTVPAAAADHVIRCRGRPLRVPLRAPGVVIRGVRVGAPLPQVAVHVVQAPGVGLVA